MKKIFSLLLGIIILASCSSDDDVTPVEDPILGKWFISEVNNTGSFNFQLSDCNKESFVDFKTDGTSVSEFYAESNGECTLDSRDTGIWSNLGNNFYRIVVPYQDIGAQRGLVEFRSATEFAFYPDFLAAQGTNIVFRKR